MIIQHDGRQLGAVLIGTHGEEALFAVEIGYLLASDIAPPQGDGLLVYRVETARLIPEREAAAWCSKAGCPMSYRGNYNFAQMF